MLPPIALCAADRLATALMALVEAVAPVAVAGSTPTLSQAAAHNLLLRLTDLIVRLIRISNCGLRAAKSAPAKPAPGITPPALPESSAQPDPAERLPRRRGWLLAALPDLAPAVVDHLRALLDDPAVATLLDAAPHLRRPLSPLLRGLDLAPTPRTPPPPPEPNPAPPVDPTPASPNSSTPVAASKSTPNSPNLVTTVSLRYRNDYKRAGGALGAAGGRGGSKLIEAKAPSQEPIAANTT